MEISKCKGCKNSGKCYLEEYYAPYGAKCDKVEEIFKENYIISKFECHLRQSNSINCDFCDGVKNDLIKETIDLINKKNKHIKTLKEKVDDWETACIEAIEKLDMIDD